MRTLFAELLASTESYLREQTPFDTVYGLALEQIPAALDPAMRSETALARLIVQLEAQLSAGEITRAELRGRLRDCLPEFRGVATG